MFTIIDTKKITNNILFENVESDGFVYNFIRYHDLPINQVIDTVINHFYRTNIKTVPFTIDYHLVGTLPRTTRDLLFPLLNTAYQNYFEDFLLEHQNDEYYNQTLDYNNRDNLIKLRDLFDHIILKIRAENKINLGELWKYKHEQYIQSYYNNYIQPPYLPIIEKGDIVMIDGKMDSFSMRYEKLIRDNPFMFGPTYLL